MRKTFSVRTILDVAASVAMIAAAVVMIGRFGSAPRERSGEDPKPPTVPLSLVGAAVRGSASAQVGMVVFSDFQCPYCGTLARDVLPGLTTDYVDKGKLLVAFRHKPLPNHERSRPAATFAACANRQNRFWAVHDRLFEKGADLSDSSLRATWASVGLQPAGFDDCSTNTELGAQIDADLRLANSLGIMSTPTTFIGQITPKGELKATHRIAGARPLADFTAAIGQAMATK